MEKDTNVRVPIYRNITHKTRGSASLFYQSYIMNLWATPQPLEVRTTGVRFLAVAKVLSSSPRPDRLLGSLSLQQNHSDGSFRCYGRPESEFDHYFLPSTENDRQWLYFLILISPRDVLDFFYKHSGKCIFTLHNVHVGLLSAQLQVVSCVVQNLVSGPRETTDLTNNILFQTNSIG